jgi:hypothetical protein
LNKEHSILVYGEAKLILACLADFRPHKARARKLSNVMNMFVCLFVCVCVCVFEGDVSKWSIILIKHLYLSGIRVGKIQKTDTKNVNHSRLNTQQNEEGVGYTTI